MKMVDLDQTIFVPVVDETHGGVTVEMQMTVGEFFEKFCQGFEPEVVEAIPVEWLRGLKEKLYGNSNGLAYRMLLDVILNMWQKEQEAR